MVATGTVHLVFGNQMHRKYNQQCKGFVVMGIYEKHEYLSSWAVVHEATTKTDHEGYQVSIASDSDDHEQHPLVLDVCMDAPSDVRRTPEVYRETVTQRCK